jgi:hypothetical protein
MATADVFLSKPTAKRSMLGSASLVLLVTLLQSIVVPEAAAQTLPYSEDFTTSDFQDVVAGQTTADWNTVEGELQLPFSTILTSPFSATTPVQLVGPATDTRSIALGDMDGDGDLDLIEGALGPNGVQLNNGSGIFGARNLSPFPPFTNTRSLAVGDVNRDGYLDFVAANFAQTSNVFVNEGTTGREYAVHPVTAGNSLASGVALADINGDGFLDAILATDDFQNNLLLLNTQDPLAPFGRSGSTGIPLATVDSESRHVLVGDLDNDGDIDIVFLNRQNQNPENGNLEQLNQVLMNQLAQGSPLTFTEGEIGTRPADVDDSRHGALGDLNGDGFLDLVVVNRQDGEASKIYFNNGSGTINANPFTLSAVAFTFEGPPSTPVLANGVSLADADNDGDLDIFLVNASPDFRNSIYLNDGVGNFGAAVFVGSSTQDGLVVTEGAESLASAVGDVNGDGAVDWVIGNQISPSSGQSNILFLNEGVLDTGSAFRPRCQLAPHSTTTSSTG